MPTKKCCTPAAETKTKTVQQTQAVLTTGIKRMSPDCVEIPGGRAMVGTDDPQLPQDSEAPMRKVKIKPFLIEPTAVTNAMFQEFVDDTGYVTEAEDWGWSFVFYQHVSKAVSETQGVVATEWWRRVDGAHWRLVNGPESETEYHSDHPVVHVSWNDARAYAAWAGGRLPTEAEWEHAARGGLGDVRFPWGDQEPDDTDFQPCNIWQGNFPNTNTCKDGYAATAPARSFAPNGYGLYNMAGNVWEWTSEPFKIRSLKKTARSQASNIKGYKLVKGGSFLCHISYCYRYRIAARTGNSPESSTSHMGFRVVFDL